jgi:hypothetical protein
MDGRPADPRAERIRLVAGRAAVEVAPGVGGRVAALEVATFEIRWAAADDTG